MGLGFEYRCEACGKHFGMHLGIGMMFPSVYQDVLAKARAGKYGREWKDLSTRNEYIAIDAEQKLFLCDACGYWKGDYDLSLYEPKDISKLLTKKYGEKTVGERGYAPYVTAWDLKEDYNLLKERQHPCAKCGELMHVANVEEGLLDLKCPKCGGALRCDDLLRWD